MSKSTKSTTSPAPRARGALIIAQLLRWTARLLSLLVALLAALFLVQYWPDWLGGLGWLAGIELALLLAAVLAMLVAWWRELVAAIVALSTVAISYLLESVIAGSFAESLAFGALALPAALFLAAALLTRRRQAVQQPASET